MKCMSLRQGWAAISRVFEAIFTLQGPDFNTRAPSSTTTTTTIIPRTASNLLIISVWPDGLDTPSFALPLWVNCWSDLSQAIAIWLQTLLYAYGREEWGSIRTFPRCYFVNLTRLTEIYYWMLSCTKRDFNRPVTHRKYRHEARQKSYQYHPANTARKFASSQRRRVTQGKAHWHEIRVYQANTP